MQLKLTSSPLNLNILNLKDIRKYLHAYFVQVVANSRLFAVGGYSKGSGLDSIEEYDVDADHWRMSAAKLAEASDSLSVVAVWITHIDDFDG